MKELKGYINGTDDNISGCHLVGDNVKNQLINLKGTETVVNSGQAHKILEKAKQTCIT